MCGRTCLTLQPDDILCACKYKILNHCQGNAKTGNIKKEPKLEGDEDIETSSIKKEPASQDIKDGLKSEIEEQFFKPEWRAEFNCGRNYLPSYNIAPTDITPVLVSTEHFHDGNPGVKTDLNGCQTRVVVPMMWSMIPFWHKGDYRRHGLTTNNCRLEHMLESKLYAGPFRRGQRCVVLCEGFYEWQTTKTAKPSERAVHLIYMPQKDDIKIYDKKTWTPDNINLLKMAGLFDVWTDENGDKIYSYSVITYESTKIMSWMHHRMPAILESEQQVNDWLDFKRVTGKQALAALRPAEHLKWHRVANIVNNARNKSEDCNKPCELVQSKNSVSSSSTGKNKTLLSWLNIRKRREDSLAGKSDDDDDDVGSANNNNSGSDIESQAKRPKYRDFKKSLSNNEQTDSGGCASDNSKV